MTGVMPWGGGIHGFAPQVVTGFTPGFSGKNINSRSRSKCRCEEGALPDEAISSLSWRLLRAKNKNALATTYN